GALEQYSGGPGNVKEEFDRAGSALESAVRAVGPKWTEAFALWREKNQEIQRDLAGLASTKVEMDQAKARSEEDLQKMRADLREQQLKSVAARAKRANEIADLRAEAEETLDKIKSLTRELEKVDVLEADGQVIYAAPELNMVTVDLGYEHGARKGMKFDVYAVRRGVEIVKGKIELVEVMATSSRARILPPERDLPYDEVTGWTATDPKMEYSVYAADEEGRPSRLVKKKRPIDLIRERQEQIRKEAKAAEEAAGLPTAEQEQLRREKEAQRLPPPGLAGRHPIAEGDFVSNPEFIRIVPSQAFRKQLVEEIISLKDVSVAPETFVLADVIRPENADHLKRVITRNNCVVEADVGPDTNYLVTTVSAKNLEALEKACGDWKNENVSDDIKKRRRTVEKLRKAREYNVKVITEEDLDMLIYKKLRKRELQKGKAVQPGQIKFYVAGRMENRSPREVRLYIEECGGIVCETFDQNVDVLVIGTEAEEYIKEAKRLGIRIIREGEIETFFGRR
ncbi:MAG: hypothetical protein N3A38_08945, partial [Planctomycetota bacterium]|nr:hypothetical protein [Planctomycetota bacterium]